MRDVQVLINNTRLTYAVDRLYIVFISEQHLIRLRFGCLSETLTVLKRRIVSAEEWNGPLRRTDT